MYVIFEQRERDAPGAAFVDGAWDSFFRELDRLLPTYRAATAQARRANSPARAAGRPDEEREEPTDDASGRSFQAPGAA
ncbi:MAG TPA: hypothetical protein PLW80_00320 [Spirochaetales bacterium]|nr:hypothetical protein [Spirochaetales bacterium]HPB64972.1 hypothetical protein [Spirochaetales bacterium]HPG85935.1 hypothetical protein [Spirochaetales bacterium]HPM71362.1 hypothetical protein [Spirochaetales bacterium]